ncbi:protein of unknown function [Tenacibaculum sp. 190130A14a]|uniref:Uncharacterized protein n=1 Tax=Tenacibaculum polynesiense TaxID=3137857 RepID=A0ABM9P7H5_9FLAO
MKKLLLTSLVLITGFITLSSFKKNVENVNASLCEETSSIIYSRYTLCETIELIQINNENGICGKNRVIWYRGSTGLCKDLVDPNEVGK